MFSTDKEKNKQESIMLMLYLVVMLCLVEACWLVMLPGDVYAG
jgi:hypothetical protein